MFDVQIILGREIWFGQYVFNSSRKIKPGKWKRVGERVHQKIKTL